MTNSSKAHHSSRSCVVFWELSTSVRVTVSLPSLLWSSIGETSGVKGRKDICGAPREASAGTPGPACWRAGGSGSPRSDRVVWYSVGCHHSHSSGLCSSVLVATASKTSRACVRHAFLGGRAELEAAGSSSGIVVGPVAGGWSCTGSWGRGSSRRPPRCMMLHHLVTQSQSQFS